VPDQATPIIECIEALKVFDNCADIVKISGECDALPPTCLPLPSSYSASCTLTSASCGVVAVVPHVPADGLANVTFRIDFTKQITIFDTSVSTPTVYCQFSVAHFLTETVSLSAPTGFSMLYQCEVDAFTCGPCVVVNFGTDTAPNWQVCCEVELCLELQSKFPVKLLVWTSGYCVETICAEKQGPTLICPPTPLFPPQPSVG
jgi:hypothetical protein